MAGDIICHLALSFAGITYDSTHTHAHTHKHSYTERERETLHTPSSFYSYRELCQKSVSILTKFHYARAVTGELLQTPICPLDSSARDEAVAEAETRKAIM